MQKLKYIIISALILISACKGAEQKEDNSEQEKRKYKETMIEVNKHLVQKNIELIKKYTERRKWETTTTKTGLWYRIYEKGKGKQITEYSKVKCSYTIHLLDGTLCYEIKEEKPKEIILGKTIIEIGLKEGLKLLHEGDKANFIMPPHIAYGIQGDNKKIPMSAIIVYDIKIIEVDNNDISLN